MRARRSTVALVSGIVAVVLGGASFAFACGGQATIGVSSSSGTAGSTITISGALFLADTPVNVYWNSVGGTLLGTATGPNFSLSATVPANAGVGVHYVVGTAGTFQASTAFRVTAGTAPAGAPAETPGDVAQSDLPLSAASPAAAPTEAATPAPAPAPAPARAPTSARSVATARTPAPAVASTPAPASSPAAVATPAPAAAPPVAAPAPVVVAPVQPAIPAAAPADRWNGLREGERAQPSMSMAASRSGSSDTGQVLALALLGIGSLLLLGFGAVVLAGRRPAEKRSAAVRPLPDDRK